MKTYIAKCATSKPGVTFDVEFTVPSREEYVAERLSFVSPNMILGRQTLAAKFEAEYSDTMMFAAWYYCTFPGNRSDNCPLCEVVPVGWDKVG